MVFSLFLWLRLLDDDLHRRQQLHAGVEVGGRVGRFILRGGPEQLADAGEADVKLVRDEDGWYLCQLFLGGGPDQVGDAAEAYPADVGDIAAEAAVQLGDEAGWYL